MSRIARALFLGRVALRLPFVRRAALLILTFAACAGAGFVAILALLAPTWGDPGPLFPAAIGILAAALAGGAIHILSLNAARKRQSAEFARLARRLGEEKTARSELSADCRACALAVERVIPEIFGHDETHSRTPAAEALQDPGGPGSRPGATLNDSWAVRRLRRIARAAALFAGTDLELKRLAFAGPCAEVIEEYRRLVGSTFEILYIEDGGGEWLSAPIDRPLFVILLRELMDNVLSHAGEWNRITVTTEPVPEAIVLRVRDDGQGIPADSLRALTAASPSVVRGGLGLPLVRAIVEAHGGTLRLESGRGQGTSATLRFPTHD